MDPGRVVFDSCLARLAAPGGGGGAAQMLLFGGGANSGGFFRGVLTTALRVDEARVADNKRPFFTTHEELLEEEYYDEQAQEKKRRLTAEQVRMLERSFEEENKLEPERKSELARRLGMAPRQVAVWFQNRRARWKTKQLEHDFDRLKAAYDTLAADHRGLLSDNDRLRAQVISLTEKLQDKETSSSATAAAQEVDQPDCTVGAMAAPPAQQLKEDIFSSGTNDNSSPVVIDEGTNHSGESAYVAGDYGYNGCVEQYGGGAISSEEEDGGAVSDVGRSFHLPDSIFATAGVVDHAAEEEVQLGSWPSWFWND